VRAVAIDVCEVCGLGWQPSLPNDAELTELYRSLRDERYVEESSARRKSFKRVARVLARYAPTRGRLLDVGCSSGLFLECASEQGWEVVGVEPATWLAEHAQKRFGDRIINATLEAAELPPASFDVVTIWDVVEHVIDPVAFIQSAARLVRPGGVLAINVPDRSSLIARLMGARWPLRLPEHLFYFSKRSLREILQRAGLSEPEFRLHPVYFSLPYVCQRLRQHGVPAPALLETLDIEIPVVMGELTAFSRRTS
jgi:SAM-dependent methyltransferase